MSFDSNFYNGYTSSITVNENENTICSNWGDFGNVDVNSNDDIIIVSNNTLNSNKLIRH